MKRSPVWSRWTEAAGFILAVWAISFLLLYQRSLKLELASVQGLISRFEGEINFFKNVVEPTQVAAIECMREVHSLEDKIASTSDSLVQVKVDGKAQLERTKRQHLEWEQQVHKDYKQLTDDVAICNDWLTILKKNQSVLSVMAKKQSVITCLMEVTGLKGDLADARTLVNRLEKNNKNLKRLADLWSSKVTSSENEVEEMEQQIKELKTQLKQQGCTDEQFYAGG